MSGVHARPPVLLISPCWRVRGRGPTASLTAERCPAMVPAILSVCARNEYGDLYRTGIVASGDQPQVMNRGWQTALNQNATAVGTTDDPSCR